MKEYFDRLYEHGQENFYKLVVENLKNKKKMFIVTANPETFIYANNNQDYEKMILDKDVTVIPDGIGIVKSAKIVNKKVDGRITGVDLSKFLLEEADKNKYNVALLGATQEVIGKLQEKIQKDFPGIKIVKAENGYTKNKDKFFNEIAKMNVDICLVALGIPAQESLIYKHISKFKKGVFVGVGGSFDVLSGTKKRAPKIFIKLNLEWLYRLIKEPKRIKRFWNNNVMFILKIKKNK